MTLPEEKKLVDITVYSRLAGVHKIEDILCLATLVATKTVPYTASVFEAMDYYEHLGPDGCGKCPHAAVCLACIINE